MSHLKSSLPFISIFLIVVGVVSVFAWLYTAEFISYADMQTVLTITTETLGVLLGIITAGLMFTQGKFSELSSELNDRSPHYLTKVLSIEKIQLIEAHLLSLRKTFTKLAATATVTEERNLYEGIVAKSSSMFVNFAVLLNLKLKQQGLPITGLLVSEMEPSLYKIYEERRMSVKKEWQLFNIIGKIMNVWEGSATFLVEKSRRESALQADIKGSISFLKLKECVDKGSANIRGEVAKVLDDLGKEISEISKRLHQDRIPQFLSQMEQASTLRGKYFYLTETFITAPLLINLLILPQLSETTANFFKPIISITSSLSVMGVTFLLLYIHKILNV